MILRRCRARVIAASVLAGLLAFAAACQNGSESDRGPAAAATSQRTSPSTSPAPASPTVGTASALLTELAVEGRAPKTGYTRSQFGSAWNDDNDDPLGHNGCDTRNDVLRRDLTGVTIRSDTSGCVVLAGTLHDPLGHNGCDTRNDVLRRDLTGVTIKPGTSGCVVLTGTLHDPYTGRAIPFRRGEQTSAAVQIDHVVALGDAWQTGAQRLDQQTRTDLANDPLELLAVDGATNEAKGDGDAATWLPPNKAYRCAYVARQLAVKARYRLWLTPPERDAAARVLARCPGEPALSEAARPQIASSSPSSSTTASSAGVYYRTCTDARAACVTPLHRGDPGYDRHLDRDGDGTACE